jgi:hypothetical protein
MTPPATSALAADPIGPQKIEESPGNMTFFAVEFLTRVHVAMDLLIASSYAVIFCCLF